MATLLTTNRLLQLPEARGKAAHEAHDAQTCAANSAPRAPITIIGDLAAGVTIIPVLRLGLLGVRPSRAVLQLRCWRQSARLLKRLYHAQRRADDHAARCGSGSGDELYRHHYCGRGSSGATHPVRRRPARFPLHAARRSAAAEQRNMGNRGRLGCQSAREPVDKVMAPGPGRFAPRRRQPASRLGQRSRLGIGAQCRAPRVRQMQRRPPLSSSDLREGSRRLEQTKALPARC